MPDFDKMLKDAQVAIQPDLEKMRAGLEQLAMGGRVARMLDDKELFGDLQIEAERWGVDVEDFLAHLITCGLAMHRQIKPDGNHFPDQCDVAVARTLDVRPTEH